MPKTEIKDTEALAFKVPAEIGWRALVMVNADDPDPTAPAQIELRDVLYWGFFRSTAATPIGVARMLHGVFGPATRVEFRPLNGGGREFQYLLEVISPADARADDVIIADFHARFQADPITRSQKP